MSLKSKFELDREPFIDWMADRLLAKKYVRKRKEAVELAWQYLQIEESDGQGGGNLMFSTNLDKVFAWGLADRGIQRDKWQEDEC